MGHSAVRVRYQPLSGHYRTQLNFVTTNLDAARQALEKISKFEKALSEALGSPTPPSYEELCAHYAMRPTRNNAGIAHENGVIESAHLYQCQCARHGM